MDSFFPLSLSVLEFFTSSLPFHRAFSSLFLSHQALSSSLPLIKHSPSSLQVISFDSEETKTQAHWREITRRKISNNIVGATPTAESYIRKFMDSPELARYQFLSWSHLQALLGMNGRPLSGVERRRLGRMLGRLVGNSVTTFFQVSLAVWGRLV